MDRKTAWSVLFLLPVLLLLTTCIRVGIRDVYAPVYLSYTELRASVSSTAPAQMRETGKIYVKDNYIYVNELHRGIHVVDNTDPGNPQIVAFIPVPGNVDLAILGSTLYADSYVDLVAIDVTDPEHAEEIARVLNAFPYDTCFDIPSEAFWSDDVYETPDENEGVVIGWEKESQEVFWEDTRVLYDVSAVEGSSSTGTGGSLARFTIIEPYLYALHQSYIQLISLEEPQSPSLGEHVEVGWDIETIFPYGNLLFIGSTTGMYIYDATDPANPTQLSVFSHVTSCDPVVVEGDRAYVTLRSGSQCGGGEDMLSIIDISDTRNPVWLSNHAMNGPYGLGIDNGTLFICDGTSGMRVFDVTGDNVTEISTSFPAKEAFDVILVHPLAIVIGPEGIDQYDYTDLDNITPLSHLDIIRAEYSDGGEDSGSEPSTPS